MLEHLTRFRDALGHDEIRAAGVPVGSGEVESAHRTIPQKRLELPGAWWHPKTVGKMLGAPRAARERLVGRVLGQGRLTPARDHTRADRRAALDGLPRRAYSG